MILSIGIIRQKVVTRFLNFIFLTMTEKELSKKLADMYNNARRNEQATMIHLFGIKYANEIRQYSLKDIVIAAGLHLSYQTEVRKGMNLSKYVTPLV